MKNSFLMRAYRSTMFNYRQGGLRQLGSKAIEVFIRGLYDRGEMLVVESDLNNIPLPKLRLEARSLSFRDLQSLGHFKTLAYPEVIRARFEKAEECFGFFIDGELAHLAWLSSGYLDISKEFPLIEIPNGTGIHDVTTVPFFRRKGVYCSALVYLQSLLKDRGRSKALVAVSADNIASEKGLYSAGFHYLYSVYFRRMFFVFIAVRRSIRPSTETS